MSQKHLVTILSTVNTINVFRSGLNFLLSYCEIVQTIMIPILCSLRSNLLCLKFINLFAKMLNEAQLDSLSYMYTVQYTAQSDTHWDKKLCWTSTQQKKSSLLKFVATKLPLY